MKVKIYIVTYNNAEYLNANLKTLFENIDSYEPDIIDGVPDFQVNIINNHSNLNIAPEFSSRVKVLENGTRPDFSVGHLSRDWNAAVVNGFVSLIEPEADVVILSQDDTIWQPLGLQRIVAETDNYSAIFLGNGDCVVALTPESVQRVGLWDERFCCNAFHEMDMFLRAAIYNGSGTSINDVWHQLIGPARSKYPLNPYLWNLLPYGPRDLIYRPDVNTDRRTDKDQGFRYHSIAREFFKHKWGQYPEFAPLKNQAKIFETGPIVSSYIVYPYFEKDIDPEVRGLYADQYAWGPGVATT